MKDSFKKIIFLKIIFVSLLTVGTTLSHAQESLESQKPTIEPIQSEYQIDDALYAETQSEPNTKNLIITLRDKKERIQTQFSIKLPENATDYEAYNKLSYDEQTLFHEKHLKWLTLFSRMINPFRMVFGTSGLIGAHVKSIALKSKSLYNGQVIPTIIAQQITDETKKNLAIIKYHQNTQVSPHEVQTELERSYSDELKMLSEYVKSGSLKSTHLLDHLSVLDRASLSIRREAKAKKIISSIEKRIEFQIKLKKSMDLTSVSRREYQKFLVQDLERNKKIFQSDEKAIEHFFIEKIRENLISHEELTDYIQKHKKQDLQDLHRIWRGEKLTSESIRSRAHRITESILQSVSNQLYQQAELVLKNNEIGLLFTAYAQIEFGFNNKGKGGAFYIGFSIGGNLEEKALVLQTFTNLESFKKHNLYISPVPVAIAGVGGQGAFYFASEKTAQQKPKNGESFYPPFVPGFQYSAPNYYAAGVSTSVPGLGTPGSDIMTYINKSARDSIATLSISKNHKGFFRLYPGTIFTRTISMLKNIASTFKAFESRLCRNVLIQ